MKTKEIIAFLKNDNSAIQRIYNKHRVVFLHFAKKYPLEHESLLDIYQDAFVILRKKALQGSLETVESSLRTYLFGIGKNLIYKELQRQKKFTSYIENTQEGESIPIVELEDTLTLTIEQRLLKTHFSKLGKKCKEVLTLFYYRGLTLDEIVVMTNYQNNAVVRSHKSRCLKNLREAIKNKDK